MLVPLAKVMRLLLPICPPAPVKYSVESFCTVRVPIRSSVERIPFPALVMVNRFNPAPSVMLSTTSTTFALSRPTKVSAAPRSVSGAESFNLSFSALWLLAPEFSRCSVA